MLTKWMDTTSGPLICRECKRDPTKMPRGWEVVPGRLGTKKQWFERVKVVAKGFCLRDYARSRRDSQNVQPRRGATTKVTCWMHPTLKLRLERVAPHLGKK